MDSVGPARVSTRLGAAVVGCALFAAHVPARGADSTPIRVVVWADRDDDDADGQPDGEQGVLPAPTRVDLVPLDSRLAGALLQVVSGGEHARIVLALPGVVRYVQNLSRTTDGQTPPFDGYWALW
jgi:hypothetical protein